MLPPEDAFRELPAPPDRIDATTVLLRLVDGLGFRYRWATEGLVEDDASLRPSAGQMTLAELLGHVRDLLVWCAGCVAAGGGEARYATGPVETPSELRRQTLAALLALRTAFAAAAPEALARVRLVGSRGGEGVPFLHMLNGPLADALTHVGQITAWRRCGGRPGPRADVFRGRPPQA